MSKKNEIQARIDELTLLADFQIGDITVMGRNERSWRDRISELEQELEEISDGMG